MASFIKDKYLEFNLSHSNELVVYSFCWDRRVGIDVEYIRPIRDEQHFADEIFSASESSFIRSLSYEGRLKTLFQLWTSKEAILKASGDGVVRSMDQFEIRLAEEEQPQLVAVEDDSGQPANWRLETFEPVPGYQAALAVEVENIHNLDEIEIKVAIMDTPSSE